MPKKRIRPPRRSVEHTCLGKAVRELRAIRGLTQEELGYQCGLHRNYVGAVERGETNPTFSILLRLLAGLRVSMSALAAIYERKLGESADAGAQIIPLPTPTPGRTYAS